MQVRNLSCSLCQMHKQKNILGACLTKLKCFSNLLHLKIKISRIFTLLLHIPILGRKTTILTVNMGKLLLLLTVYFWFREIPFVSVPLVEKPRHPKMAYPSL